MSSNPGEDEAARLKEAERERLFKLPDFPTANDQNGVLLSDRIKYYCQDQYKLIAPFEPERLLRPAGYDLTVGGNYSINGDTRALNEGMKLEIGPYQVAIIQTYETLNMPRFLIGRWNIRVKLAYKGLLWVGGAQVDPGFRGHLCCPIYNLSTRPVVLQYREPIAMIDFVTTTPYEEGECKKFDWQKGKVLFPEYPLLDSGIEDEVKKFRQRIQEAEEKTKESLDRASKDTKSSLSEISSRIDTFLVLVFTVVAVLFAGLGIVATTSPAERSFINPPAWVAAIALYFAMRARSSSDAGKKWYSRRALALVIAGAVLIVSLSIDSWGSRLLNDLLGAKGLASRAVTAVGQEKEDRETAIRDLQRQSDAKLDELRQQLSRLQAGASKPK